MSKFEFIGMPEHPVTSIGLGVFDGLHIAHQHLAEQCDALLTFHPHPDLVLRKDTDLKHLTTLSELQELFRSVVALSFNKDVAQLSPTDFLDLIKSTFHPKKIVVGYDYRFGYKRQGDFDVLSKWAKENDIEAVEIQMVSRGEEAVKSGQIRRLIRAGEFETSLELLGHDYAITGTVVPGEGRGKTLGIPTANLKVDAIKLLPEPGVYSAWTRLNGSQYPCIVYIGDKPTFDTDQDKGVEVHIPNFEGDLYARELRVYLNGFIRGQQKFDSAEALVAQINTDILEIKRV
jgi:riboflavin kinase/FMN adenylyltransferase